MTIIERREKFAVYAIEFISGNSRVVFSLNSLPGEIEPSQRS